MPSRHRLRVLALALIPALVGLLWLGRWVWDSSRVLPERGGTHVEAVAGRPQYVNPLLAQFNEIDRDLVSLVFAGLVKVGATGDVEPDLAESWDISPDGKTYTFRLHGDRKWHDGRAVTADDVLCTIRLLQDPNFPGLPDVAAPWRGVTASKIAERTVRFTLVEPYGPFLEQASLGILPAHLLGHVPAAELLNQAFNGSPVGAGPFKVTQANAQQITLAPDPAYPGPKPFLESLVFRFYPSPRAAATALAEGQATGARYVPASELAQLSQDEHLQVFSAPHAGRAALLFFNARRAPFAEANVRRALSLAVDRGSLIAEALAGQGQPAYGPINPLSWAYRQPDQTSADLAQARALLEQAGWRDADGDGVREKDGQPLAFALATSDAAERQRAAKVLAAQFAAVGAKVEVAVQTWEELRDNRLVPRDFAAALAEVWLPNRDPDVLPFWHSAEATEGFNFSGWSNPRADELLSRGRQTWLNAERQEIYAEFQSLFAGEAPAVFLYYPLYNYALSEDVKGARLAALLDPAERFRSLAEWYIRTRRAFF